MNKMAFALQEYAYCVQ